MNLEEFVNTPNLRNQWIREKDISIYVRKSKRNVCLVTTDCLDIASVEVDEGKRGKGVFKTFLSRFERTAKSLDRISFIECVQNLRLRDYLLQEGYDYDQNSNPQCFAPCLFKVILRER